MHTPKPTPQHDWLRQLVGEWTAEMECVGEPGKPPERGAGTESVRAIGDLWVVTRGRMEMPGGGGGSHESMMTLGYDPGQGRFVGTFVASMMTLLWQYEGALDAAGKTLTLDTRGPSMMPGADPKTSVPYKDAIELVSADERVMTSATPGPDGNWVTFMTVRYRRKK